MSADTRPRLALVLSGGGARAAYQVGVLAAITERAPPPGVAFDIITGVSAGAINAMFLASHPGSLAVAARELQEHWARLTVHRVYRLRPPGIGRALWRGLRRLIGLSGEQAAVRGLMDMSPLRRFLAGSLPSDGIAANVAAGRLRAAALSATSYGTGRVVSFVQGVDELVMWQRAQRLAVRASLTLDHVLASSSIPILFPAVKIGDDFFGDGSVRQTAPLAPAIHLGATRVLAIGMRTQRPESPPLVEVRQYPSAAEAMGLLFHAVFLDSLEADRERLEQINSLLHLLPPEDALARAFRPVRLLMLQPSRDLGAMARGYDVILPPVVRLAVLAMGGRRAAASDFLSYLLFDPAYTSRLIELGHQDAYERWSDIEEFLAASS